MAKKPGPIKFIGASGKKYRFLVLPYDTKFRRVPVVYILTRRYQPEEKAKWQHDVIYVGETLDIRECMETHPRKACFEKHKVNTICIYPEYKEKQRHKIVEDLSQGHKIPCD